MYDMQIIKIQLCFNLLAKGYLPVRLESFPNDQRFCNSMMKTFSKVNNLAPHSDLYRPQKGQRYMKINCQFDKKSYYFLILCVR